jgi:hypothetical protein
MGIGIPVVFGLRVPWLRVCRMRLDFWPLLALNPVCTLRVLQPLSRVKGHYRSGQDGYWCCRRRPV